MVTTKVIVSDNHIWNFGEVVTAIASAKYQNQDLELDLNAEGPAFEELGLFEYIGKWDSRTTVITRNPVQQPVGRITFIKCYPHFITSTKDALCNVPVNKEIKKPVGIFIGRSNVHRLYLSSYIYSSGCAHQTFRYDHTQEFHQNNLGFDGLVQQYGLGPIDNIVKLLHKSPLTVNDDPDIQGNNALTYVLHREYTHFLVEIVCETYYSGRTFFPTEKTWRPIMLETPFIVQGPQWYLHRLKDLGFRTFDSWWDEGYSEDPADHQPREIVKVINYLTEKSKKELDIMYEEMLPTLKHNKKRFMELTSKDFEIFKNDNR